MMKRVLITIHYLELGGAEMSLLGLLESLDYSETEVDLFVYSHRGELMRWMPAQVNLLPEIPQYKQIERPIKDVVKEGFFRMAMARIKAKFLYGRYAEKTHPIDGNAVISYVSRELSPILSDINPGKEYDIVVSYLAPHYFVLDHVRAKEKIAWIHTDYSNVDVNTSIELPVWDGYDSIVSISPDVTINFLGVFPSLEGKIVERPNMVPREYVRMGSEESAPEEVEKEMPKGFGRVNLLSVGRFCRSGYDRLFAIGPSKYYLIPFSVKMSSVYCFVAAFLLSLCYWVAKNKKIPWFIATLSLLVLANLTVSVLGAQSEWWRLAFPSVPFLILMAGQAVSFVTRINKVNNG